MTIKFGEKTDVTISSGTNRILFDDTGAIGLRGANYGNIGDVITNGTNGLPTWAAPTDTIYTGSTGVTINGANQISIGQDVNVSADVAFKALNIQKDYTIFPITEPTISFTDNQAGGIIGIIESVAAGGGGDLRFKTRNTSGSNVEHLRIQQSGLVSVKNDFGGLLIATEDGTTEQANIYNSGFGTRDLVIDAAVGSQTDKGISFRMGSGQNTLRIARNGSIGLGATNDYGNNGEVLTSQGSTLPPIWSTPSAGGISAYHAVTIQTNIVNSGGWQQLGGFANRITPVNIGSNSIQPFIIPTDGGGTYVLGYAASIHGGYKISTWIRLFINGASNLQRDWLHVDRMGLETEVTPARTYLEQLNSGDIITFQAQVNGASPGNAESFFGSAWIMKIN